MNTNEAIGELEKALRTAMTILGYHRRAHRSGGSVDPSFTTTALGVADSALRRTGAARERARRWRRLDKARKGAGRRNVAGQLEAPAKPAKAKACPVRGDGGRYLDEDTLDRIMVSRGHASDESGWHNGWQ